MGYHEWEDRPLAIRRLLREVGGDFDDALIGCPPNLHLCSFAAKMAATHVMVPMQAQDHGDLVTFTVSRAISPGQGRRDGRPGS
jgi:chromosome partitioning protein